jgi:glutaconyl-CoA/methylmalonyl-CoA decarboxylase subunit gamma
MRYYVNLDPSSGDEPLLVDVTELPTGALDVSIGGRRVDVDVVALGDALSVRIDGQIVDLTTEGTPPDVGAIASGHRSYVRVESERMRAAEAAKKTKGGGSDRVLKSPMPGRVVKVLVKVGDLVVAGQPLLVVEAMKMENELKAKAPATIAEIHVAAGATVEANAKLVTFAS